MKTAFIVILFAAMLSSCATAHQSRTAEQRAVAYQSRTAEQKAVVQQEDKDIAVEEGIFLLRNLAMVSERFLSPKLKGDVINNTTKDWNEVVFEVELYDQSGKKLNSFSTVAF